MIFEGIYRRFTTLLDGKNPVELRLTQNESTAISQVEPSGLEMTRAGKRFLLGHNGNTSGITAIQAFPTTATSWVFLNIDTSKTYFFETIGMYDKGGTPGIGGNCIFAIIYAATGGSNPVGLLISSASGGNTTSNLIVKTSMTITGPAAPNWSSIGDISSTNVGAFPGSGNVVNRDIAGRIAIQPGQGLALSLLAPSGTGVPAWTPFAEWIEAETDMD